MKATENVATENVATENVATENVASPTEQKAANILRARLPKLADKGLNFEKRTGNFFTASTVKETEKDTDGNDKLDKNGKPIYVIDAATGQPTERVRRLVVDIVDEAGDILPEYVECIDDVNAKRAAVMVVNGDAVKEKLDDKVKEAEKALQTAIDARAQFDADLAISVAVVEAYDVPVTERAPRLAVSAKLESAQSEIERLKALLIAAGIEA